jgi:ribosome recycling factor
MTINDVTKLCKQAMDKAIVAMDRELSELRTGRANPKMVEGLHVDYYGAPTMIKDLATISASDARMIVIQPWDASAIVGIEKAIQASNLGLSTMNDGKIVRVMVPQLSGERREELVKTVKKIAEAGKVSLRTVRHEYNEAVKTLEKAKAATEDQRFKALDEIQKMTDAHSKKIDDIAAEKEKELRSV